MNSRSWLVCLGSLLVLCATACGRADESSSREAETLATTGEGLTNGVPVGSLSGLKSSEQLFTIDVPEGMARLVVTLTRGTGDPDLYVRRGSAPTTTTYDCHSVSSTAVDECSITGPQAGTWYVMVRGYLDYSGTSLVASYTPLTSMLSIGQSVTLSGAAGSQRFWTLEVPASQTALRVRLSGGTGNADLYVNPGAPPTITTAACASVTSTNGESCSMASPAAGTWYVLVRGATDFSGATLTVSAQAADGSAVLFLANEATVSVPKAEIGDLFHYAIEVPAGQTQLRVRTSSTSSANANLYVRFGDKASITAYDCRSEASTAEEDCVINNPQAGTWFILIHSKQATQDVSLQATHSNGALPSIALTNGKPLTNLTVFPNSTPRVYTLQVPAGFAKLSASVSTTSGTVYARFGAAPVLGSSYDNQCSFGSTCEVSEPQAGTWYFMVVPSYRLDKATFVVRYSGELSAPVALVNGQAVTGIALSRDDIRYYTVNVPSGQGRLVIDMSSGAGGADFYVRAGSRPTPSNFSCSRTPLTTAQSCVFDSPASGLWYIQVRPMEEEVADVMVKATWSSQTPRTTTRPLSNGEWVQDLSGTPMVDAFYSLPVPANVASLTLETLPGVGDVRVYLKQGAEPTSSNFTCVDRCVISLPASGTWYARVRARENYSGLAFRIAWQALPELPLESWVGPVPMGIFDVRHYRVEVPSGVAVLNLEATNPGGRLMLLNAARGALATSTTNCNIVQADGKRRCSLVNPLAGTWYVRLENGTTVDVSDVQLRASADWLAGSTTGLADNVPVPVEVVAGLHPAYTVVVPEGQAQLDVDLLTQEDAELSLRYGGVPTSLDAKCRATSTRAQPGATCSVPSPTVGTWYATVKAAPGFQGRLRATTTSRRSLMNGVPDVPVSGLLGEERLYRLEVPAGMSDLSFTLRAASSTAQLAVRYGTPPDGTADCTASLLGGKTEETCAFASPAAGTWYATVRGNTGDFSGAVVTGTYVEAPGEGVPSLSRGVPAVDARGGGFERKFWMLEVPAGQAVLKFDLLATQGKPELYVQRAARPTPTAYACVATGISGTQLTCTVQNPVAGTWFVMARAPNGFSGAYLTGTYWKEGDVEPLTRGVPRPNLSGTPELAQYFQVEVPAGQSFLSLDLFGSSTSVVMTARQGVLPTAADTACAVKSTNRRACEFANPAAGTWYVRLGGTFSAVSLSADSVGLGATDGIQPLLNGGTVATSACITASKPLLYKLEVPSGMSKVTFTSEGTSTCGGAGVDLRVLLGSPPTLSDYDCLSNAAGSTESCTIRNPVAGTWYVHVVGDASNVRVVGSYE